MSDPTPAAAEARATKATREMARVFSQDFYGRDDHEPTIRAILKSLDVALSLPPPEAKDGAAPSPETGWRLVPVKATDAMIKAGDPIDDNLLNEDTGQIITREARIWQAMLAAAPSAWDVMAAAPAAPSPDLAALEELSRQLERAPDTHWDRRFGDALRTAIHNLKAQPNAGPSANDRET